MIGSEMQRPSRPLPRQRLLYAGVALVMMSNLMLELLLTRIFSATMWYHFAFVAVSVALFGTTVGAVIVHLFPRHFAVANARRLAGRYALIYALSVVACMVAQLRINAVFEATWENLALLALLYLLVAVPFTLSGVFICLALLDAGERIGTVYATDLLGAAVGCALFVPFAAYAEGPRGVLLLATIASVGAALTAMSAADRRGMVAGILAAAVMTTAFVGHLDRRQLRVRWSKGNADPVHAFEKWSAFSRIVIDPVEMPPFGWGLSALAPIGARVEQEMLTIDGAAATILTRFDGDVGKIEYLKWDVTAAAYAVRPVGSVLVIGVGGGRDVLTALAFGHGRVVGLEVNGAILAALNGPFAELTGHLGDRAGVELIHDEARSYAARSSERFDIIQASLVDTWAAAASGAYVLSENALYTREAFEMFLSRLGENGILSVSRWHFDPEPGESLRLVALAAATLRERGVTSVQEHLILVRNRRPFASVATLLIGRRPFLPAEVATLEQWCASRGFEAILGPGFSRNETLSQLTRPQESSGFLESHPLDLSTPTDDRPFFFSMLRLRDVFEERVVPDDILRSNVQAVVTLVWFLVLVVVLSALFILGPLCLPRRERWPAHAAARLFYFAGLGLGFILVELSLMQRLLITLGHPVYGLTVVLFSLLAAAGAGSWWTQRIVSRADAGMWLGRALLALLLVAILTGVVVTSTGGLLEAAPTWARIIAAVMVLLPLGFVLGVPLATGLALSADDPPGYRALYWGVNGATSVCGSVLAMLLSLAWGISATFACGVMMYGICAVVARSAYSDTRRRA